MLDQEDLGREVIGVGQSWGAGVLSRAAIWQRQRFDKLEFLSVGYSPPGTFLDVDGLNVYGPRRAWVNATWDISTRSARGTFPVLCCSM
jgi:hypothetical protein